MPVKSHEEAHEETGGGEWWSRDLSLDDVQPHRRPVAGECRLCCAMTGALVWEDDWGRGRERSRLAALFFTFIVANLEPISCKGRNSHGGKSLGLFPP